MASLKLIFNCPIFTILLWHLVSEVAVAQGVVVPPSTLHGSSQQLCNYQFAIPNGGNCVLYGPALEQTMSSLQNDMDRLKLQYVTDTSVFQQELRKLRQQASATSADIADVNTDLKALQSTVATQLAALAASNSNSNNNNSGNSGRQVTSADAILQQQLQTTRMQLTQDLLKLENKIDSAATTLTTQRQQDAIEQSKVNSVFQGELRQQQQDLTAVLQSLQNLQSRLNNVQLATAKPQFNNPTMSVVPSTTSRPQPPTSSAGSFTSDPVLPTLLNSLQDIEGRVIKLETVAQDVPELKKNVSRLLDLSHNQTLVVSDVQSELDYMALNKIPDLQKNVSNNYGAISLIAQTLRQDLDPLPDQVQRLEANVSSLMTKVSRLGTDSLSHLVKQRQDETQISDLALQVKLLARRMGNFINQLGSSSSNSLSTSTASPSTTAFNGPVPTPRPRGTN